MRIIILLTLMTIICLCLIKIIYFWNVWNCCKSKYDAELTYQEFNNLYDEMPEVFELRNDYVLYKYVTDNFYYKTKLVGFKTYLDYCKYKIFYTQYEKMARKVNRQERQKEFMDQVQHDLAERREENEDTAQTS